MKRNIRCIFNIIFFDGLRLSGIERSTYIESYNLGRKSGPVSGIERIRYSGCFITLKKEGKNSGPTKTSGFVGIPVLRGSGLEGFYCTIAVCDCYMIMYPGCDGVMTVT